MKRLSKAVRSLLDVPTTELAAKVEQLHSQILGELRTTLELAKQAGDILLAIKQQVGHGHFTTWLDEHFSPSAETARVYMRISENWRWVKGADTLNSALRMIRELRRAANEKPMNVHNRTNEYTYFNECLSTARNEICKQLRNRLDVEQEGHQLAILYLYFYCCHTYIDVSGVLNEMFDRLFDELVPIAPVMVEAAFLRQSIIDHRAADETEDDLELNSKADKLAYLLILNHFKDRSDLTECQKRLVYGAVCNWRSVNNYPDLLATVTPSVLPDYVGQPPGIWPTSDKIVTASIMSDKSEEKTRRYITSLFYAKTQALDSNDLRRLEKRLDDFWNSWHDSLEATACTPCEVMN